MPVALRQQRHNSLLQSRIHGDGLEVDAASTITVGANQEAERIRASAEAAAEHVRREADEYAARVRDEVLGG